MLDGQLKQSVEGEEETIPPPEIAASSPSGAIGHINSEVNDRAAQAPTSRATLAPIREDGSAGSAPAGSVGSAPSPVVTPTTEHVRKGDNDTEDQVRQRITEGRQGVRQMITEGRQGHIAIMHKEKFEKEGNIVTVKKLGAENIITAKKFKKDVHDINKSIAEVVRDNEELNDTIKKIIENGIKDDDDIVNMINNMVVERNRHNRKAPQRTSG